jgi:hypothetical protein
VGAARELTWLGAAALVVASAGAATADPPRPPPSLDLASSALAPIDQPRPLRGRLRALALVGENLALILPSTIYYWNTTDLQEEDWELDWDWDSWRKKLTTFDALILDTGNWTSNSIRHPIIGAASYQTGRAVRLGPLGATLVDVASAVVWEYIVEFKERIAVNDLVVNTVSGYLIGEPLFQIGLTGHRAAWPRRAIAFLVSPFDRLHAALGRPAWIPRGPVFARHDLVVSAGVARQGGGDYEELGVGLDLEVIRARGTGSAGRNRAEAEVRFDADRFTRLRVATATTFGGRLAEREDDRGRGSERFFGAGGGFELDMRLLAAEWDRLAVFHLIGPRAAGSVHDRATRFAWEVGASADVGMVQAHVFGPVLPWEPEPQTSVLRVRGYYYATGVSLAARLAVAGPTWSAALRGSAQQLWSIDGLDRHELHGGPADPHDVADQRVTGRATIGTRLRDRGLRLELELEGALRRGTWQRQVRLTTETTISARAVIEL